MASKVVRVREDALEVASRYSPDISTAILIMHAKLEELEGKTFDKKEIDKLIRKVVADTLSELPRGY